MRSAQVSAARTKGSGTNLSYILLGYFPDWVVRGPPKSPEILEIKAFGAVHGFDR
ncbi:hypothetical protein PX52LOC_01727 [Limnoglobus roseus]|uniref:Uncharacterized protein n=1 Tax=Limnoglobus roseus TaxID=2598579 RepID=A0A5C1A6G0_9BACT|nr:hypothetical protein PX52LOC_01727 [Limnoglobus roseus]